jgi:dihydrofolate reductase
MLKITNERRKIMRKLIVSEFVTLDGVMEDPGGAEKSKYGGWSRSFAGPEYLDYKLKEVLAADILLIGRKTYEGFAAAWPSMKDEAGFADKMNGMKKVVVSHTLKKAEWNNSNILSDNIFDEIKKLKQQAGQDILVAGSGQLVNSLLENELVDELRLMVHPILVGGGKRLFGDSERRKTFALTETITFSKGVEVLVYQAGTKMQ